MMARAAAAGRGRRALVGLSVLMAALAGAASPTLQAQGGRPGPAAQQPTRDTPAQQQDTLVAPAPMGLISGRVIAADTGRPVKRARVFVSAAELPGGRGVLSDDGGAFELAELPAGRYTLSVSKSGFVAISYGQRRPLQAGTPIQLADGQQMKGVTMALPRGSVINGHVYDETGDAMPGVLVRVLRYQYLQGDRRLTPAGTAQTDDLGQYRVWGLMPGDYYVDAQSRINLNLGTPAGRGGRGGGPGGRGAVPAAGRGGPGAPTASAIAGVIAGIAGGNVAALFAPDDESQKAYAPTYYPGVSSVAEARPITVGLGQEAANIDFGLQLVHVARVSGHVTDTDGNTAWNGNVSLVGDTATSGRGGLGVNYGSRIQWDGTFGIGNVPPGRYTLQARGTTGDTPQFASQPITVGEADIDDVSVLLTNSASITGVVAFPAGATAAPDFSNLRVTAPATGTSIGGQPQGRVDKDGKFTIDGIAAGLHLIRPGGQLRGWTLKSVTIDGRDVTDTPIELRSGQTLQRVELAFTDKTNEINGTLKTDQGAPVTEYTVLAFSTDSTFWQPQSRHIATARPDQNGQFRIRGLPAGGYYLATVDPAQQGEWFEPAYLEEHRLGAARVTLGDGDTKTQDFTVRLQ
jgi:carboxypeptidase family protein